MDKYRLRISVAALIFMGVAIFCSCKNDMNEVHAIVEDGNLPEMEGSDIILIYSDSAMIKYKIITPEYVKAGDGDEKFEEFPRGLTVISYDKGKLLGSITSKYAKKLEKEMIWEARDSVVVENDKGTKLETELMFWNMATKRIYSDRYTRLTSDSQIIEGNDGFESDQDLRDPIVKNITGVVEVENP